MKAPRTRLLLLAVFLGTGAVSWFLVSRASHRARLIEDRALFGPGLRPDRVILTWTGDPARSQSVTWRSSVNAGTAVAQIARASDGPAFQDAAAAVEPVTETLNADSGPAAYHSARFENLDPGTVYAYRVGSGAFWSEWHQFRTASAEAKPLQFIYVGDAQNDIFSLWSRLIRAGYREAPNAAFLLHAGDLVNRGERDAEWGEWFAAAGWINGGTPSLPAPGNHEYIKGDDETRRLTHHWRPQFDLPRNGPPELAESCYYIDIQGVLMIVLNSNERHGEQAAWLDRILTGNPNRWTIAAFHHPIYSAARSRDNPELRAAWQPVFDKHRVDLVLQGHDHSYARSNLMRGVNTQGPAGTVYVVSVSGPKMYPLTKGDDAPWMEDMARVAEDTQLFQVIEIDGDRLRYEAHTARGVLYDAFELHKRNGQPNELVNLVSDTPARRRGE